MEPRRPVRQHVVRLSNGRHVVLLEDYDALDVGLADADDPEEVDAFLCRIDASGVLVYPNSGEATAVLTRGLPAPAYAFPEELDRE